jgi:hypothetical protein
MADWDAWIKTIEPLEFTAEEEAVQARIVEEMRHVEEETQARQETVPRAETLQ